MVTDKEILASDSKESVKIHRSRGIITQRESLTHKIYFGSVGAQAIYSLFSDSNSNGTGYVLGISILGASCLAAVVSQNKIASHFKKSDENSDENSLCTTGPYAIIRQPLYTSLRGASIGLSVLDPSLPNLALTALNFITSEVQMNVEERRCSDDFGQAYENYMEKVPRAIPGGKWFLRQARKFSAKHPSLSEVVNYVGGVL